LVALPWSQDGRSGIAFRAETITTTEGGKPGSTPRP